MYNYKINTYLNIIFFISLISIISAFFIEYVLGHQPCNLCLMQRIPYGLSIILIILNFLSKKNEQFIIILLTLLFSFSFIIAFYHLGIEQGFIQESLLCNLEKGANIIDKDEIIKQLQQKSISCKDVTFKIFGLSLTNYNIIISLLLTIGLTKIYFGYEKNR